MSDTAPNDTYQPAGEPAPTGRIAPPPRGWALLFALGPSIVWCAEYIGSGEVILATRTGAVLGIGVLWAVVVGVVLKYFIGLAGGLYTVTTGESMIAMIGRLPRVGGAMLWLVLVLQLAASVGAIASIAASAGVFLAALVPLPSVVCGWLVTLLAVAIAWIGEFRPLKIVMACLVTLVLAGVVAIAFRVLPTLGELLAGLTPRVPAVPDWAVNQGVSPNAWGEILPLLGWGAGGFASQVWYTYWVLGAGYGAAGKGDESPTQATSPSEATTPARDPATTAERMRSLDDADLDRLRGWRRVIVYDATVAMLLGVGVTCGFLIAGAGVLGARQLAPAGPEVATTLASVFGADWGPRGATLFLVGGAAALVSTQLAQVAGWPQLLDECVRLCLPRVAADIAPLKRRRAWLVFYLLASITVVYTLGFEPVSLVRYAAIAEGLVLTPLQALAVLAGLYVVLPRLAGPRAARAVTPGATLAIGLIVSFVTFSYFCVVQLPKLLS